MPPPEIFVELRESFVPSVLEIGRRNGTPGRQGTPLSIPFLPATSVTHAIAKTQRTRRVISFLSAIMM
jgi:hypothetical protein